MWTDLQRDILEDFVDVSSGMYARIEDHAIRMSEWQRLKRNRQNQESYTRHADKRRAYLRKWRVKNKTLYKAQRKREKERLKKVDEEIRALRKSNQIQRHKRQLPKASSLRNLP